MVEPVADGSLQAQFWAWSVKFYGAPDVSAACLVLQDRYGADVNIVLLLLWLASRGAAALDAAEIASLDAAVASWREQTIVPLRALRRALKGQGEDPVRRHIAAAELEAERSAQRRLVQAAPVYRAGIGPAPALAQASLRLYGPGYPPHLVSTLLESLAAV